MLVLNCLVLGETPQNTFPVEIDAAKSVGSLKKSIKEEKKPAFEDIVANTLTLWRPSIYGRTVTCIQYLFSYPELSRLDLP